mgnify:CR=1 FL=1
MVEDLDPDNDVEPPYRRCREQVGAEGGMGGWGCACV